MYVRSEKKSVWNENVLIFREELKCRIEICNSKRKFNGRKKLRQCRIFKYLFVKSFLCSSLFSFGLSFIIVTAQQVLLMLLLFLLLLLYQRTCNKSINPTSKRPQSCHRWSCHPAKCSGL